MAGSLPSVSETLEAAPPANALDFEKRTLTEGSESLPYRLFRPKVLETGRKYPLVLFLHGAGERGGDNEAQLRHGLAMLASPELQAKTPVFVVAPQCPTGRKWSEVDWSQLKTALPEQPSVSMSLAMKILDSLQREFPVDPQRLYLTGLSMGGYGSWDAAERWPERFAAVVPVCGGGDENLAGKLTKLPIWVFHGDQDKAVPVARSRNMVEAIRAQGGNPKYTEYAGVGHNSWDRAYADPALYEWLFAQVRPQ